MTKKFIMGIFSILVLSGALVLLPWALTFQSFSLSTDPSDWGVFGDYFGGVLSTVISALGFIAVIVTIKVQAQGIKAQLSSIEQEKEIRDDEVYRKQAIECLNEALFKLNDPRGGGLLRCRVAWLESARLILTAQELSNNIKSESVQKVYATSVRLVRSRFQTKLDPKNCLETMQPNYFDGPDWTAYFNNKETERLEKHSVYVIYEFASWQKDEADNLDSIKGEVDVDLINLGYLGARLYIINHP